MYSRSRKHESISKTMLFFKISFAIAVMWMSYNLLASSIFRNDHHKPTPLLPRQIPAPIEKTHLLHKIIYINNQKNYQKSNQLLNGTYGRETRINKTESIPKGFIACYQHPHQANNLFYGLITKRSPIFFFNPTCTQNNVLTYREACAIESAAKMNPNSDIYVLSITGLHHSIEFPKNVYFFTVDLPTILKGTVIEELATDKTGPIFQSHHAVEHINHIVRWVLLWKYGGTFLDFDILVMSNFHNLAPNSVGVEHTESNGFGVLHFSPTGPGNMFLQNAIYSIHNRLKESNNDPQLLGAQLLTSILKEHCRVRTVTEMTTPNLCPNVHVYPYDIFYPVPAQEWRQLFQNNTDVLKRILNRSKVIKVWSQLSHREELNLSARIPYAILANAYCPTVASYVKNVNHSF